MDAQHTNELTSAMLAGMDISPFTAEHVAEMTEEGYKIALDNGQMADDFLVPVQACRPEVE
ncbi:hypothetical protein SJI19_14625 [Acerihabitans sp. TG2]|uniref:hypothetical protein n=1 Tax=Acerihabitans sp. TG2 TaxID=3096008 RepID=UPI002B2269D5|nr:hypothetical protein [Acerihabitans sp. TG2]MEA9391761.1 hypothetical protein [Acerihabitans sp. TG2]